MAIKVIIRVKRIWGGGGGGYMLGIIIVLVNVCFWI